MPDELRPAHYGGAANVYEAIKVIEAWDLNFSLGNALKYICRAGKKPVRIEITRHSDIDKTFVHGLSNLASRIEDLKKASTYLDFEIDRLERLQKQTP